jgi:hypothetical protein
MPFIPFRSCNIYHFLSLVHYKLFVITRSFFSFFSRIPSAVTYTHQCRHNYISYKLSATRKLELPIQFYNEYRKEKTRTRKYYLAISLSLSLSLSLSRSCSFVSVPLSQAHLTKKLHKVPCHNTRRSVDYHGTFMIKRFKVRDACRTSALLCNKAYEK